MDFEIKVRRDNAQKYSLIVPRGFAKVRDQLLKGLFWKHSKFQKGYIHSAAYKTGRWNGRVPIWNANNIKAGYLKETLDFLNFKDIPWSWEDGVVPELPFYTEEVVNKEEFFKFAEALIKHVAPSFKKKHNVDLETRDYQVESAFECVKNKLGIIEHATGAGKSLTISLLIGYLFHKKLINRCVIIVPIQMLVTQFKNDLMDFGFNEDSIGMLYADEKQTSHPITIVCKDSLRGLKDTRTGDEFFSENDLIICDECHNAFSKTVYDGIEQFVNMKYQFGFTGTLPENELDREKVLSLFGRVLDVKRLKTLEEDYSAVSTVTIGMMKFNYGKKSFLSKVSFEENKTDWQKEVEFVQNDDKFRNPYIVKMILDNFRKNRNIVVLVKNILYGERFYDIISKDIGVDNAFVIFSSGSKAVNLKKKNEILSECKNKKDNYVIVTNYQIFKQGINIPNINLVVLIDGGESKITVCQSIGRGVRKTKEKSEVFILDCYSDLKYGHKHGLKRKKIYKDEGFRVLEREISIADEGVVKGLEDLKF